MLQISRSINNNLINRVFIQLRFASSAILRPNTSSGMNPIESSIRRKLKENLKASFVEVINESYMHNVPKNSETHFKVVAVSELFNGVPLLKRHRMVNDTLKEELEGGVHALSIIAKTPDQWAESEKLIEPSPSCRGGFGK